MNSLIIGQRKTNEMIALESAFKAEGFKADYINIAKLGLVTKGTETEIKADSIDFRKLDACFIAVEPKFVQFVEPLLDELADKGVFCQIKPESYYITSNRPFQMVVLNQKGLPAPKMLAVSEISGLEKCSELFSFPVMLKTFKGLEKTQSIIVESELSLNALINGMKTEFDAITIQEFVEANQMHMTVIGKNVFSVERKWTAKGVAALENAIAKTAAKAEQETAIKAAKVLGLDIASVRLYGGKVTNVTPKIEFETVGRILGKDLYKPTAQFFRSMVKG